MKTPNRNFIKLIIFFTLTIILSHQFCPQEIMASPLSTEEERKLGQKFMTMIRKHFDLVDDDFANEYINDFGHYLISPLETRHFPFRFYVIKNNTPNAFAGPGGHIFLFSGLIEAMDEVDEVAAVICHEIGHVTARHLANRIDQSKKIGLATMAGMLAAILIGGKAAGAIMTGSVAAGIQAQLHYSRNDERQADQLGFKYMDEAGLDPSGMVRALKNIGKGQWFGTDRVPRYLLTHPGGTERMSNIDIMMSNFTPRPGKEQTAKFRGAFPFFKAVLRAKCMEHTEAEELFNREIEKDPDSMAPLFGLGVLWKERSEYDKAINYLEKALKGQPDSVLILANLGEAYQLKGQDAKAITIFERAIGKDKRDKSALFLLARSYQNLEEYPKAIRLYERLTAMKPVKDEVFYNLGVSYGRQERLARAHYNFGVYFERMGSMEKAKFHFQKANALVKSNPALRRRIQKAMKEIRSIED